MLHQQRVANPKLDPSDCGNDFLENITLKLGDQGPSQSHHLVKRHCRHSLTFFYLRITSARHAPNFQLLHSQLQNSIVLVRFRDVESADQFLLNADQRFPLKVLMT